MRFGKITAFTNSVTGEHEGAVVFKSSSSQANIIFKKIYYSFLL